jgi:hypothetical protein
MRHTQLLPKNPDCLDGFLPGHILWPHQLPIQARKGHPCYSSISTSSHFRHVPDAPLGVGLGIRIDRRRTDLRLTRPLGEQLG